MVKKMLKKGPNHKAIFLAMCVSVLMPFESLMSHAQPTDDNLPIFTSPIDITGLGLQLHALAPDRETGKLVEIAFPPGFVGPQLKQLFSMPLSSAIQQYWTSGIDPKTGMTPRQAACDGPQGIKQQVAKEVAKLGSSFSAYNISCNLATTGQLLASQVGSTMYLAYLLTNNTVSFASTSPATCGTVFCLDDPKFVVTFAFEIITVVRTPSICFINAENATVDVVAASIDSDNAAGDIAKLVVGQKFVAAEVAITNTVQTQPLPLDDFFKELRTSDGCTGKAPGSSRLLNAFRQLDTKIDLRQGIMLRAIHVGIVPPLLIGPDPSAASSGQILTFTRPMISTTNPIVTAGNAVQVIGQLFPLNMDPSVFLLSLQHGGYGEGSLILGGDCFGGATEIKFGLLISRLPIRVDRLSGDAQGKCPDKQEFTNLRPRTTYTFRARDCDPITCSPWSRMLKITTSGLDDDSGKVILTMDAGIPIGTAIVDKLGTFTASITIPSDASAGLHTIHAVNGEAKADMTIQVTTTAPTASIMMVALLFGETGCPNHPIDSIVTDNTVMLFGSGFPLGTVIIHLDTVAGTTLGTAAVRGDGSFCQQINTPPSSEVGKHNLLAVQNGAVVAQTTVTFVKPYIIR